MSKKITVELTEAEANALYRLAENSAYSDEDAMAILGSAPSVQAGYRALDKLASEIRHSRKLS